MLLVNVESLSGVVEEWLLRTNNTPGPTWPAALQESFDHHLNTHVLWNSIDYMQSFGEDILKFKVTMQAFGFRHLKVSLIMTGVETEMSVLLLRLLLFQLLYHWPGESKLQKMANYD